MPLNLGQKPLGYWLIAVFQWIALTDQSHALCRQQIKLLGGWGIWPVQRYRVRTNRASVLGCSYAVIRVRQWKPKTGLFLHGERRRCRFCRLLRRQLSASVASSMCSGCNWQLVRQWWLMSCSTNCRDRTVSLPGTRRRHAQGRHSVYWHPAGGQYTI